MKQTLKIKVIYTMNTLSDFRERIKLSVVNEKFKQRFDNKVLFILLSNDLIKHLVKFNIQLNRFNFKFQTFHLY